MSKLTAIATAKRLMDLRAILILLILLIVFGGFRDEKIIKCVSNGFIVVDCDADVCM